MNDDDEDLLVERLAKVMMPDIGNDVRHWPPELQELHRRSGWRSFADRTAAVDMERRRMDVRAVLNELRRQET